MEDELKMRVTKRLGVAEVARGAEILRAGGLVAFPTETVYGLGANALDAAAVASIFAAKQRPGWDPVIVHVADRAMADRVAMVSPEAERLMEAFWPGPLTLLLPRTRAVPDNVTAGRDLVGVRMPSHPVALDLIRLAGVPVAAPSANRFGHTSPTTAEHVLADLDGKIDAVIDGGGTSVGVESTVLDVGARIVYRPGAVLLGRIAEALGEEVTLFQPGAAVHGPPEGLPSPGVGIRHYAPRAKLVLVDGREALALALASEERPLGVMLPRGWASKGADLRYEWGNWEDGEELASRLFSGLRRLDGAGAAVIVCPVPPVGGIGAAMRDRLEKAARVR